MHVYLNIWLTCLTGYSIFSLHHSKPHYYVQYTTQKYFSTTFLLYTAMHSMPRQSLTSVTCHRTTAPKHHTITVHNYYFTPHADFAELQTTDHNLISSTSPCKSLSLKLFAANPVYYTHDAPLHSVPTTIWHHTTHTAIQHANDSLSSQLVDGRTYKRKSVVMVYADAELLDGWTISCASCHLFCSCKMFLTFSLT